MVEGRVRVRVRVVVEVDVEAEFNVTIAQWLRLELRSRLGLI